MVKKAVNLYANTIYLYDFILVWPVGEGGMRALAPPIWCTKPFFEINHQGRIKRAR